MAGKPLRATADTRRATSWDMLSPHGQVSTRGGDQERALGISGSVWSDISDLERVGQSEHPCHEARRVSWRMLFGIWIRDFWIEDFFLFQNVMRLSQVGPPLSCLNRKFLNFVHCNGFSLWTYFQCFECESEIQSVEMMPIFWNEARNTWDLKEEDFDFIGNVCHSLSAS